VLHSVESGDTHACRVHLNLLHSVAYRGTRPYGALHHPPNVVHPVASCRTKAVGSPPRTHRKHVAKCDVVTHQAHPPGDLTAQLLPSVIAADDPVGGARADRVHALQAFGTCARIVNEPEM
jgi:hypothetical protein